jgi:hypothetical protein
METEFAILPRQRAPDEVNVNFDADTLLNDL